MAILLHKYLIDDNAKMYLNKAFNMALGYSHHKYSTIFEYMDSIEYFIDFNFGDYENRLKRINRIINAVSYTHLDVYKRQVKSFNCCRSNAYWF